MIIIGIRHNCQHAQKAGGYIGRIRKMIKIIKQAQQEYQQRGFDIISQVFAEEDPSINSGLNGNAQEYTSN